MKLESFPNSKDVESDPETYAIIGAAMEVHRELGCGFLEPVYQEALALELETRDIPFQQEVSLEISYKGTKLNNSYRADFICNESVLVEIKATDQTSAAHRAQVINYLNATGLSRGLLINFGARSLQFERTANLSGKSREKSVESA